MRHFHLTNNQYWRPVINVDKLWSLVPEEEKQGLTETSEVVPVIDTLHHGYGKVLGNGKYVPRGHERFLDCGLFLCSGCQNCHSSSRLDSSQRRPSEFRSPSSSPRGGS